MASTRQRAPQQAAAPPSSQDECRCLCGSLLARRTLGGIELKCRRCKRSVIVALEASADE